MKHWTGLIEDRTVQRQRKTKGGGAYQRQEGKRINRNSPPPSGRRGQACAATVTTRWQAADQISGYFRHRGIRDGTSGFKSASAGKSRRPLLLPLGKPSLAKSSVAYGILRLRRLNDRVRGCGTRDESTSLSCRRSPSRKGCGRASDRH